MIPEIHETATYMMAVEIDALVLPLVAALNECLPTAGTLYSCQGFLTSEADQRAYVGFLAGRGDVFALITALEDSGFPAKWTVECNHSGSYVLRVDREHIGTVAAIIRKLA